MARLPKYLRDIENMVRLGEPKVRRAFLDALRQVRGSIRIGQVQALIAEGRLEDALAAIPWDELAAPAIRRQMMTALRAVFEQVGDRATAAIPSAEFSIIDPSTATRTC